MAQLVIELPADLQAIVQQRVADSGYVDAQDYIKDLIAADASGSDFEPPARVVSSRLIKGFGYYPIFHQPISDGIEIVNIVHGARDLDAFFAGR